MTVSSTTYELAEEEGPMTKKDWRDLTGRQKAALSAGSLQVSLLLAALLDIYRRPGQDIRGSKAIWTLASFVNFVGPISYFLFGRRR